MSAKPATTPRPYLSGFCNPTNPMSSHERCRGSYVPPGDPPPPARPCSCDREGCPCRIRRLQAEVAASGAILCGPEPTEGDLAVVAEFAAALRSDDPAAAIAAMGPGQHGNATTLSLQEALLLQQRINGMHATVQQHHNTATGAGTPVEVTVTGDRWVWEADAAAEIMLQEDGACPMCSEDWPVHLFLDDGRVACP